MLNITKTDIEGLVIFAPTTFRDNRGYFFESYHQKKYREAGITPPFVQDNQSYSIHGTLRGLHFQLPPYDQAKLVRVLFGTILDVAVDLRRSSPTFGRHFSIMISSDNQKQVYLPRGFAHGFSVLSNEAIVSYKCDNYYHKESEGGIIYNDKNLNIDWKLPTASMKLSTKDEVLLPFDHHQQEFFQ